MSAPAVDVVVNNHNYADYLGDAIESALRQTHPDVRVIVVDDGSTDSSREVVEEYAPAVTAVFKENGGQGSAFNAGLERSRADVVLFLDADDVLLPETAARVAAAFTRHPDAVRVQYRTEVIDAEGRRTGVLKPPTHIRLPSGDLRRETLAFPFDVPWVATSANAFASAALRRIFPVPEDEFRILADWYVVHLTSLLGRVISLEDVGAYRRIHGANGYELSEPTLDLVHVRQSIHCAERTLHHLHRLALELQLANGSRRITAVSDIANRLISVKLAPESHPLPRDGAARLVVEGIRASLRRYDVSPPLRLMFILWFLTEGAAPPVLARPLAEAFMFPERRRWLDPILTGLKRT